MKTKTNKSHPLIKQVKAWKKDQAIISLTLNEMLEVAKDHRVISEQKVDGQTGIMKYSSGKIPMFGTLGGVLYWELPVLDEIARILQSKKINKAVIVGELAGYSNGKILPFNKTESLIKNPKTDKTKIHWFPYQILELNDEKFDTKDFKVYEKTWAKLKELFSDSVYVHPVKSYSDGIDAIKKSWKKLVEEEKNEGIVVRLSNNKVYKVKPVYHYDLVIIAVGDKKKGKNWPKKMISMALVAFMDNNKIFRTAGHVASGFTENERKELFSWAQAHKVSEDDTYVWVKPRKIMEVQWERTSIKEMPSYKYTRNGYKYAGKLMSGTVVKPRFIRWRTDKSVTPDDLRLTQIPGWSKKKKMAYKVAYQYITTEAPVALCTVFSDEWNEFTKEWFYKIYKFLANNLGEFAGKLSGNIKPLPESEQVNALYEPYSGDIYLRKDMEDNIPYLLGNLLRQMVHANIGSLYDNTFPIKDFAEGFIDYLCEVLSEDSFWGEFKDIIHKYFISLNKQQYPARLDRWNGQIWARNSLGKNIVQIIKAAKEDF